MTTEELLKLAGDCGFDHAGPLDPALLEFNPAVRDMCRADTCRSYGKNWCCPPHCGTLEEFASRAAPFRRGILVQSTGEMEDDFDVEAMMDTEHAHKERFNELCRRVREQYPHCFPMAAGACSLCPTCTCPDAPCRFPGKSVPSMEACGLVVSKTCEDAGLPYYYGPKTITFTSCILID
ncbi:MAG: DUF2284 domain-containing protein [Oscillospiraceae bacterium]|nr:DUF2284 domain-containing protein [Oscillospiraceae bacterium]